MIQDLQFIMSVQDLHINLSCMDSNSVPSLYNLKAIIRLWHQSLQITMQLPF